MKKNKVAVARQDVQLVPANSQIVNQKSNLPQYHVRPLETGIEMTLVIPKKLRFISVWAHLLEEGFSEKKVKERLLAHCRSQAVAMHESFPAITEQDIERFEQIYYGFSIYDVDGAFLCTNNIVEEERSCMIKIISLPDLDQFYQKYPKSALKIYQTSMAMLQARFGWDHLMVPAKSITRVQKEVIEYLRLWLKNVALFIYGYFAGGICDYMRELGKNDRSPKPEEEIWITSSIAQLNRIVLLS